MGTWRGYQATDITPLLPCLSARSYEDREILHPHGTNKLFPSTNPVLALQYRPKATAAPQTTTEIHLVKTQLEITKENDMEQSQLLPVYQSKERTQERMDTKYLSQCFAAAQEEEDCSSFPD